MNFKEWLKPKHVNKKQTLSFMAITCLCLVVGFVAGYYEASGMLPIFTKAETIGVPEMTKPTITEVQTTLEELPDRKYEVGYNCVDFAWEAFRALAWEGQPSAIVMVTFEEGKNHALLLVATTDQGWVFIEPSAGMMIRPRVGGVFNGKTIASMKVLVMRWVDYMEWQQNPIFEEIVNE